MRVRHETDWQRPNKRLQLTLRPTGRLRLFCGECGFRGYGYPWGDISSSAAPLDLRGAAETLIR
jgi:hypothetical protein